MKLEEYDSLIFDLDGTLWNACGASSEGWTNALKFLKQDIIITAKDIESICGMVYDEIIAQLLPNITVEQETLSVAINKFERESIEESGGELYSGVYDGILKLKNNYQLFIVSNCQDWYLESFLDQFKLRKYFTDYESHGRTNKTKGENIKSVVDRNSLKRPVYIGDTAGDLKGASVAGVDFVYARYGYGDIIHAPYVDSFNELVKLHKLNDNTV